MLDAQSSNGATLSLYTLLQHNLTFEALCPHININPLEKLSFKNTSALNGVVKCVRN